jgi:GntR family histidine utilization transcriptional repressor
MIVLDEGPAPLYQRVKQLIVQNVASGAWGPDHKIPSENELVRDLGISRMTVHRALRELTSEGMLVRVHGVGTFVAGAKPQAPLMEIRSIADEIRERGHEHRAEVIWHQVEEAPADVASQFSVMPGTQLYHTVLTNLENEVPIQLEDRWVNPAAVPRYLEIDPARVTPHHYLMQQAPLSEGEHIIEAVLAEPWERKHLQIDKTEPCLLIRRRTWSNGQIISAARLLYPGARYRLGGRFMKRGS